MSVLVTVEGSGTSYVGNRGVVHKTAHYFETNSDGILTVFNKVDDKTKVLAMYRPGYWLSVEYIEVIQ